MNIENNQGNTESAEEQVNPQIQVKPETSENPKNIEALEKKEAEVLQEDLPDGFFKTLIKMIFS